MADVNQLAPKILKWESTKFTDNANDAGGATKDGVTFSTFQHYETEHGKPKVSVDDLKNLSIDEFAAILKELYWDHCNGDSITDQQVANIIVDWFWGSGYGVLKILQEMLGISPTGFIGPVTIAAINSKDPATLVNTIADRRIQFYKTIVAEHPNWQEFLQGWINRANDYRYKTPA